MLQPCYVCRERPRLDMLEDGHCFVPHSSLYVAKGQSCQMWEQPLITLEGKGRLYPEPIACSDGKIEGVEEGSVRYLRPTIVRRLNGIDCSPTYKFKELWVKVRNMLSCTCDAFARAPVLQRNLVGVTVRTEHQRE